MGKRATSLQDIADATGYSLMTVSRAIRGTGKVKEATAKKIFAKADELGYSYNPEISRMMSLMRSGHRDRYHENIALLWFTDPTTIRKNPHLNRIYQGALERAVKLGYKVESFHFDAYELKARRVSEAIASRGIRGVILFPLLQRKELVLSKLNMDWDQFTWVAFGNTHTNHEFHRVGHHHLFGMELAMQTLKKRGYKRPFLLISEGLDTTVHHAYGAGFLANHPLGLREALDYLYVGHMGWDELKATLIQRRVDSLIMSQDPHLVRYLRKGGLLIPGDLAILSLHCLPSQEVSGIDQCNDILGQYAVDMIVAQLHRQESGLPDNPKLMLHKGAWHEGATLSPAAHPAPMGD
ncbi:MAG: LacI family DNA-binding transcriptional regulator [Puniceicoccaceae bacterium]